MDSFEIVVTEPLGNVRVLTVSGYFGKEAGMKLREVTEELLATGQIRLVLNFGPTIVINSLGICQIMDLTQTVLDDFRGCCILTGLDGVKTRVLKMAGILDMTGSALSLDAAILQADAAQI